MAAWIAHVAFWVLLVYGWVSRELGARGIVISVLLWIAGRTGLSYIPYTPAAAMFSSFVAILDIALVFAIFKGDVRLT